MTQLDPDLSRFDFIRSNKLRTILTSEDPDLALLPDHEIENGAKPNSTLWELRARLWILIDQRLALKEKYGECDPLKEPEIREGICQKSQFSRILSDPFRAAFLARPLKSPEARQEDQVRAANARIMEVLAMPMKNAEGLPDKQIMKMVLDTAKMVLDRKYGTAVQRTETLARVHSAPVIHDVSVIDEDIEALSARTEHAAELVIEGEEEGGT